MARGAVVSISHGGGPMPVLGDPGHAEIVKSLKERVPRILKLDADTPPRAIVVVTAHWSEDNPTISCGSSHALYYDYGGFPAEAYRLKYPAPGSPEVAGEVKRALEGAGFAPVMDEKRGWDHGVFIPFLLINPAANIPIVQLSVLRSEDPAAHLRMGRALASLRQSGSNIAIVGSGFASFHNLPLMFAVRRGDSDNNNAAQEIRARAKEWNAALTEAVMSTDGADREARLCAWRGLPHAFDMHPRGGAEHFLPLLVCCGAFLGDGDGVKGYKDGFYGVDIWSFYEE